MTWSDDDDFGGKMYSFNKRAEIDQQLLNRPCARQYCTAVMYCKHSTYIVTCTLHSTKLFA